MSQEKILIVDDEENERSGLAELIAAWGYRTETARDGLEGLEKAASWGPDLIITDLKMPRLDGMGLLERLAEQPQTVAVVLLTAQGSVDSAVRAMKLAPTTTSRSLSTCRACATSCRTRRAFAKPRWSWR